MALLELKDRTGKDSGLIVKYEQKKKAQRICL